MNYKLQHEIISHILGSFGVISLDCIDRDIESLMSKKFEIKPISFEDGAKSKVWATVAEGDDYSLKILLADLTVGDQCLEYALLVALKGQPCFGVYAKLPRDGSASNESRVSASMDGEVWIDADVSVLASFFAGMEQIKQYPVDWTESRDHDYEYKRFQNFIEHAANE